MSDTEERWTACTEAGELIATGTGISKAEAARGVLHASTGVWIWRDSPGGMEVLLARRSQEVKTWPGLYGMAAGGHVVFGQTVQQTVVQETAEEIGLTVNTGQLRLMAMYHSHMTDEPSGIIENDLVFMYGLPVSGEPELHFADREVDAVKWVGLAELQRVMAGEVAAMPFIPQGAAQGAMALYQLELHYQAVTGQTAG